MALALGAANTDAQAIANVPMSFFALSIFIAFHHQSSFKCMVDCA
jgi:hypothetical protein